MDERRRCRAKADAVLVCLALGAAAAAALFVANELSTSGLQARLFARLASEVKYWTAPGPSPSPATRYTHSGPYDRRLGYAELPEFLRRLQERNFAVVEQARISNAFLTAVDLGLFAPYREKNQAGLTVLDCRGEPLFAARYPQHVYPTFESVPRLMVDTLLFIENRELFRSASPTRNPAVEWDRFAKALADQVIRLVSPHHGAPGGSTLATQLEKYRHSPEGRTSSGAEKLRQMASASMRSYLDGEETFVARRRIVLDYVNTVPLAARPGYGEVNGIADGLRVWFGRDYREINWLLTGTSAPLAARALAYKQTLALFISQRRPSFFLLARPDALEQHTDRYLALLADAGTITPELRDAALAQPLGIAADIGGPGSAAFASRKAANSVRNALGAMLGRPLLYDVDRLDLTAEATLDANLQRAVTQALVELRDPAKARAAGLMEQRMLQEGDPDGVIYSFTLYERTPRGNVVRVQADNVDQPIDINENTKLDLGSTAKLRTLIAYLEIVSRLHTRYAGLTPAQLRRVDVAPNDAIARWAADYLAHARSRDLESMLEAALDRRYSASPYESFFTGGGVHEFVNFEPEDNGRILSVREGLRRSVNLVFVRLMRDIVRHVEATMPGSDMRALGDIDDPARTAYLVRFADQEGSEFLRHFYRRYEGKSADEALEAAALEIRPTPRRLAVLFRSLQPYAGMDALGAFLREQGQEPGEKESLEDLYVKYGPERFNLNDRAYLSGLHPLHLWLLEYLRAHPGASMDQVLDASRGQRQAAYAWLFKPHRKGSQDNRIRILMEADAFREIHRMWKRLGYPFDSLVPSYATALGTSADRPAALAELMGILVSDGIRLPTVRIQSLHFAAATPYETLLEHRAGGGQRVLPVEVARVTRRALAEVVEAGTARRLKGVFKRSDGQLLQVGGKTGTGDHRFQVFGRGHRLLSSRVMGRSGVFVFYVGDRYFGTLTAYVRGARAANYNFTSGLTVQILKVLAPRLMALTNDEDDGGACRHPERRLIAQSG